MAALLLVLGLALGSFLHVIASRYDPEQPLLGMRTLGGRSHCSSCDATLRWYELIPLVSYAVQRGRCRSCGARLSLEYPVVEIGTALTVFFVTDRILRSCAGEIAVCGGTAAFWVAAFLALLLLALVDLRQMIIPDEITIFIFIVGAALAFLPSASPPPPHSFIGEYAILLSNISNPWGARMWGALFGAAFFLLLVGVTGGRGMGLGDAKLAAALGFLFGWPDVLVLVLVAFLAGSVAGAALILTKRKTAKSFVPFGPFLALASLIVFFFGRDIVGLYFKLAPGA